MTRSTPDLLGETVLIMLVTIMVCVAAPIWFPIAVLAPQALLPAATWFREWAKSLAHDIEVHDAERRDEVDN